MPRPHPNAPPENQLSAPAATVVAQIVSRHLDDADEALARGGSDDDALHDLRVAVRRARSTLRAYRVVTDAPKRAEKALRDVQAATSEGRDAEVLREWAEKLATRAGAHLDVIMASLPAPESHRDASARIEKRLARARKVVDAIGEGAAAEPREASSRDEASRVPFGVALAGIARVHAAELSARLQDIDGPSDEAACHAARIAGKRLRYLLEPIAEHDGAAGELVDALKRVQDELGSIHDLHVLLHHLARGPAGSSDHAAVASAAIAEVATRFAALGPLVLHDGAAMLSARVDDLARDLERHTSSGVEVERKYLLREVPPGIRALEPATIVQGWLPGRSIRERLRRIERGAEREYLRTLKLGRGVRRTEIEEPTTPELFDSLFALTEGKRVEKKRYSLETAGLVWEIDVFSNKPLVLAEVELPSPTIRPPLPAWLAPYVIREVTDESEYVNYNLAE